MVITAATVTLRSTALIGGMRSGALATGTTTITTVTTRLVRPVVFA
ncbi:MULTISPECIES: hypothetical protein [unclassified Stenotrophomonas]